MFAIDRTKGRGVAVLAFALVALVTSGCASLPSPDATPLAKANGGGESGRLDVIGEAVPGTLVELPPGNALGARQVRVVDEYRAASGRLCRHVVRPNDPASRAVCRRADGHWSATRALFGDAPRAR